LSAEQTRNFQFFVRHVAERYFKWEEGVVDYYFIVNGRDDGGVVFPVQCNVVVVRKDENGADMCSYRTILERPEINISQYTYFFFINAGIMGPFIPTYYRDPWYKPWIDRLNKKTKLVGPYLSCQITPHVPTPMFVTDDKGLSIFKNGLGCDRAPREAELKISQMILDAGYKLGTLMTSYQNTDVSQPNSTNCNGGHTPYEEIWGFPSQLFELMFVKGRRIRRKEADTVLYNTYIYFAEHYRVNCHECWINYRQINDCEDFSCTPPPFTSNHEEWTTHQSKLP